MRSNEIQRNVCGLPRQKFVWGVDFLLLLLVILETKLLSTSFSAAKATKRRGSLRLSVIAGPGLVFVVYPEALAKFPVPQLWSVMFFAMLLSIGVGSQVKTPPQSALPGVERHGFETPSLRVDHLRGVIYCLLILSRS